MRGSHTTKSSLRFVFGLAFSIALVITGTGNANAQQPTLPQLEAKLEQQYAAIQDVFFNSPGKEKDPGDFRERLSKWQDNLAQSFAAAGKTIDEILQLYPPDREKWIERKETMWLYSQPVSPPSSRMVFGAGEVQTRAQLIDAPPAEYTDAARAAKASGEVRSYDPRDGKEATLGKVPQGAWLFRWSSDGNSIAYLISPTPILMPASG